jgi:hypothetical protein
MRISVLRDKSKMSILFDRRRWDVQLMFRGDRSLDVDWTWYDFYIGAAYTLWRRDNALWEVSTAAAAVGGIGLKACSTAASQ